MSELHSIAGNTAVNQEDAALAARLVERCCGPDAPLVLAILGLDKPAVPAPRRETQLHIAPDPFRRTSRGKGRRHR